MRDSRATVSPVPKSGEQPPPGEGTWLGLGQASRLLGVDQSTLRRWTDAGHIRSYRTPGGHRRFAEADLRAVLSGETMGPANRRYGNMGTLTLSRIRRRLQRPRTDEPPWPSIPSDARERLRGLGRRLVSLVFEYLARRTHRSVLLTEARSIGEDYGKELLASDLHLPEVLEAFTFFRKNLEESTRRASQRNGLSAEETLTACEETMNLADEVLLGVAGAFDEAIPPTARGHRPRKAAAAT